MIAPVIVAVHVHGNDTVIMISPGQRNRGPRRPRRSGECAAHLDVMRIEELIDDESYGRGLELLERVVAMLTRMIDP